MRNKVILFICLFIGFYPIQAQIDTEFWFAAPEITSEHADRPIILRISSLNSAATVTITQPANPGFVPITGSVAANSSISFNLTSLIDFIENNHFNSIESKGLFIKSTAEITAYYEVYGIGGYGVVNTDIFVLKGRNALGKEFYTPFQTHWNNNTNVNAWSSFDIVATENNTVVNITPSKDIVGHSAGIPFSVTLHKGQTFSCRALSGTGPAHPAGSYVTSNKPIAITVKDDSILEGGNYDLAGDQIVPVSIVGREYVVIKGSGAFDNDHVFICATQNNTDVFIDGNPVALITLNAGQTYDYKIINNSTYIETSKNAYVFHVTGLNGEMAGALLPPLACTGSRSVRFTRNITNSPGSVLKLNIIVKTGKESYFKLNGNSLVTSFNPVPGSGGVWMYSQLAVSTALIPEGSAAVITNDSADFHLGVTLGIIDRSFQYGYFSDYGSLDLGVNQSFCEGGSIQLDAGIKDSYLWGSLTNSNLATSRTITVSDSGVYYVTATKGTCDYQDTVTVSFYPEITERILSDDTTVCASLGYIIRTDTVFSSYNWQDGSKAATFTPAGTGYYSVEVSNAYGCLKSDSIFVTINANPVPDILNTKEDKIFCTDSSVVLDAGAGYANYLWMNGDTNQIYSGGHINEDKYWVTVTDFNDCSATDTFETDCSIYIEFPNLITPNGDSLNDVFFVKALKPGKWSMEVFNRWGNRVYLNQSYDNTWNGENNSDGIYYFHLKHVKGVVNHKGWVQIWGKE
jgi:gliding motility-associated-like protein